MEFIKTACKRWLPISIQNRIIRFIIKHDIDIGDKAERTKAAIAVQNSYDLKPLDMARKIVVFLVPNDGEITGGVLSIYHFVKFTRELDIDSLCVISTVPGKHTYAANGKFKNTEKILRWEQIINNCSRCEELVIHVPEFFAGNLKGALGKGDLDKLRALRKVRVNVLNQNIDFMPSKGDLQSLYSLTEDVGHSVGFERFSSQQTCNSYGMPLYFVPSYIDLSNCVTSDFSTKKKLILYSNDYVP